MFLKAHIVDRASVKLFELSVPTPRDLFWGIILGVLETMKMYKLP